MTAFANPPCDDGVVHAAPAAAPCTREAAPWVLAATILGSGMVFVDGTVVNVALPALQTELDADIVGIQWVVESYALFLAALLLAAGAAGDRYGRRLVFSLGTIVFAAASVWCGAARSVEELVLARAVQGVGAALLVPNSLAIISASFDESERGRAFGTWAAATAITAALGPVLGGWLIDQVSWRAIFFLNVPLAIAVLIIAHLRVPESRSEDTHGRLDWLGALLATIGLGGVVYGLLESTNRGWSDLAIWSALTLGILALIVFVWIERRQPAPMLPLRLFQSSTFSGANVLTFLLYAALAGGLFFVPLNLIQVQGYSATAAGAALLPFVLLVFLLSRWAGGLVTTYGARLPLIVGPIITGVGYALFAVPSVGGSYWSTFFPATAVLGLGMAISVAPLTTAVMGAVEDARAGIASGVNNAASRVASVLAVALFGIIMTPIFGANLDHRLAQERLPAAVIQTIGEQREKLAAIELPDTTDAQSAAVVRGAVNDSFVTGFRWLMLLAALLAFASALVSWRSIEHGPRISASQKALPR